MTTVYQIPGKVLPISITSVTTLDIWPYDDGTGDPYRKGGASPKSYVFEIDISITGVVHSSHLTRQQFAYNGLDVYVGDWVADVEAKAFKITEVVSKTTTTATLIIEDIDRYNIFNSDTGSGDASPATGTGGIIFTIGDEGQPILQPFPATISQVDFVPALTGRFMTQDLQMRWRFFQYDHGLSTGDAVVVNPSSGLFEPASAANLYVVGTVADDGPGTDVFTVNPSNRITDNYTPALPGNAGDVIYVDPSNPGELTTTPAQKMAFLQLTDAVPTVIRGVVTNPTTTAFNVLAINGVNVTFTGTTLAQAIIDINTLTPQHGVTASSVIEPTVASTNIPDLLFGIVGNSIAPPVTATINGNTITLDKDDGSTFGAGFADIDNYVYCMRRDLAGTDIKVEKDSAGTGLVVTELDGNAITIVNVSPTNNSGSPRIVFAGSAPQSGTGLPLSVTPSTNAVLKLANTTGDGIILQDIVGTPRLDFGVRSAQNGRLPIGSIIEQGFRRGNIFVVADITARDALSPVLVGDIAHVLDKGDGEWGLYLYDGTQWVLTSTEESANVDSDTVSITINAIGSSGTNLIKEINDGHRVTMVTVEVIIAFDGSPTLTVGDSGDNSRLMEDFHHDLSLLNGVFQSTPNYHYQTGSDVDINAYFNPGGSSVGQALITITYS